MGSARGLYHRPMKIGHDEVRRIAALAHLDFDDAAIERLAGELSSILTHMESLSRIDTSRIEPTFHSLEHGSPLREDVRRPSLGAEEATKGAPGGAPGQFLVPRVIG
jgi:aspartyl-tRNA(Asn)/glutamyl-tRNA(Gln) amidotransferase subunit C